MKRVLPMVAVALVLAAHLALAGGRLAGLPEMIRLALACGSLVLLPGAAFAVLAGGSPGGPVFAAVRAFGFGVAWNALAVAVGTFVHVPLDRVLGVLPFASFLLWLIVLAAARRRPVGSEGDAPRLRGAALAIVLLAAALAALHAGRTGTPVSYESDSPDHIGTIRRMIATGQAFPNDAFFRDAGPAGADPRKGLWHPQVAMIAMLAHVDPAATWIQLSAVIAPFFILNLAFLGWLARGGSGAAVFAVVQLVVLVGASHWWPLRKAVFATFLADQLTTATVFAVISDTLRPARRERASAIGLALGAVVTHVYSAIQLAVTLGAFIAGLAIRERRFRGPATRALVTSVLLGVAALPYLLWRAHVSYAPVNVIHTAPQGLLWIGRSLRIVSIGVLWDWMGILWILVPLAAWALWRDRGNPAALYVLTTSLAVALLIFDPFAVAVLEPRLGYLLMRMIWMIPIGALIAWLLLTLVTRLRGTTGRSRLAPALALAGVLAVALPTTRDALAAFLHPHALAAADREESPLRWATAMRWMDRTLAAPQVVLSDPATSYGVPMLTRHWVATLIDQHSSPSDAHALERILDARDALDPYASWERTRAVIAKYGVTAIVINSDFPYPVPSDYWSSSVDWAAAARVRLASAPAAFERLYDRDGFTVYRVHRAAVDTLSAPPRPRPFVTPFVSGRFPIGHRYADDEPVVHRLSLWPLRVVRGDTLRGVADWRALQPLPAGCYRVSVRFDQALPGGFTPPGIVAKPARKLLEKLEHRRFRFREDHLPVSGAYGVDLWRPEEIVRDSFAIAVPPDVAPGYYRAEIRMNRSPHYPNLQLSDYFSDRDYFSGVAMGAIEVVATRADLKRPPAPLPTELGDTH